MLILPMLQPELTQVHQATKIQADIPYDLPILLHAVSVLVDAHSYMR